MPIDVLQTDEDYILYNILCDYCDRQYTITYDGDEDPPKQTIECCAFCSNLIEEPVEGLYFYLSISK